MKCIYCSKSAAFMRNGDSMCKDCFKNPSHRCKKEKDHKWLCLYPEPTDNILNYHCIICGKGKKEKNELAEEGRRILDKLYK